MIWLLLIILLQSTSQSHFQTNSFLNLYHDNKGLNEWARTLTHKYSDSAELRKCLEDEDINYLHIGNRSNVAAVIVCNIHARQVITSEICLNWAQRYLQSNQADYLSKMSISLFYNANINRDAAVIDHKCDRKSKSGVDMNRNFPTQFSFYNSTPSESIYPGQSPISEPFTRCLSRVVVPQQTKMFLDIHSGQGGGLFYQQGYNSLQDRQILQQINKNLCLGKCRVTTLARDGEAINGHIFADLKVRLKIKHSLLIQIYGNEKTRNCLKLFNPDNSELKQAVIQKWSTGIQMIVDQVRNRQGWL